MALYSWLLHLLHMIISLCVSLFSYWSTLSYRMQFHNVTKELLSGEIGSSSEMTVSVGAAIMKSPVHLGILIFEDTYSIALVAAVMAISYAHGICHISFYAQNGVMSKDIALLRAHLKKYLPTSKFGEVTLNVRSILGSSTACSGEPKALHVYIVQPGEGKGMLSEVAKQFSHSLSDNRLRKEDISIDLVDQNLQGMIGCPDPELVLRFGDVPSLCGYLPWQMRLAEIISLPTLKGFTTKTFQDVLKFYSKVEQRFGK